MYAYAKLACRTLSEEVKAGLAMVLRTSKGEMHRSLRCSPQGKTHATMDNNGILPQTSSEPTADLSFPSSSTLEQPILF